MLNIDHKNYPEFVFAQIASLKLHFKKKLNFIILIHS